MFTASILEHWKEVRRDLFRALDKLTDEQLNFVPCEGLWSLGQVACHIAQAEEFWFRFIVKRELAERPRFLAERYSTVASVKALLTEVHDRTEAYLATLSEADLDRTFATSGGEELSLRWIILHVFEHEIHHRGEIFLMLGLMGMEGPDI